MHVATMLQSSIGLYVTQTHTSEKNYVSSKTKIKGKSGSADDCNKSDKKRIKYNVLRLQPQCQYN